MNRTFAPLIRLGLTAAIVWFYYGLTSGITSNWLQFGVVIVLAIPTWIVVAKYTPEFD